MFAVGDAERREHFCCLFAQERWSTLDGPWTVAELVGRAGELDGLIELWVLDLGPEVASGEVLGLCHFSDRVNGLEGDVVLAEDFHELGFGALFHPGMPEGIDFLGVLEGEPAILETLVMLPFGIAHEFHEPIPLSVDHRDHFEVAVFDGRDLPGVEGVHVGTGTWSRLSSEDERGHTGTGHDVAEDVHDREPRVLAESVLAGGPSEEECRNRGVNPTLVLGCVVGQAERFAVWVANAIGNPAGERGDQGLRLPAFALRFDAEDRNRDLIERWRVGRERFPVEAESALVGDVSRGDHGSATMCEVAVETSSGG